MSVKVPLIPIKRNSDEYYRYKMQRLVSKIVSRENGVRTLIPNSRTISRQLYRPQSSLARWFSYSLGVPSQIGQKNGEEILINGDFHNENLQRILYDFIDRFVLCPVCQNPETLLILNNDENYNYEENNDSNSKRGEILTILIHCKSCGSISDISNPSKIESKMINFFVKIFSSNEGSEIDSFSNKHEKRRISDIISTTTDNNASLVDMSSKIDVDELNTILKQFGGLLHYENDLLTMTPEMQDNFYDLLCEMIRDHKSDEDLFSHYLSSQKYKITESTRLNWYFSAFFESDENKNDFAIIDILNERRELFVMILQDEDSQKKFLSFFAANLEEKRCHLLTSAPVLWDTIYRNEIAELAAFISWYKKPITRIEKDKEKAIMIREIVKPFFVWLTSDPLEENENKDRVNAEESGNTVDFEKSDVNCVDIDAI